MDQEYNSKKNTRWVYLIFLMAIIYIWHGYQFGRNDQIEWLPYSIHLSNPHIYPADLYLNYISDQWPNERWPISFPVSWFVPYEAWACFIFHAIFFFILLSGLWKIAGFWLKKPFERSISILVLLVLMHRTDLGGNEIYYNYLVSSLPAKALGTWAIFFMYCRNYQKGVLLLVIATFFQALVGIQLVILLTVSSVIRDVYARKTILPVSVATGAYLLLCGWWIVGLIGTTNTKLDTSFFELIQFRVPHHFIPSSFDSIDYGIYALLTGLLLAWLYRQKSVFVSSFTIMVILGCLVYTLGVEVLHSETILKSQWFKTTLWLEVWFCLGLTAILFKTLKKIVVLHKMVVPISVLIIVAGILFSLFNRDIRYDFPGMKVDDEEIRIATEVRNLTEMDDVFIIPFDNSTFRYWSKRNVYVDFKSVLHSPDYLNAWYPRIREIYGLSITENFNTLQKSAKANQYYLSLHARQLSHLKADFLLTDKTHLLDWEVLTQNTEWVIYKIPKEKL